MNTKLKVNIGLLPHAGNLLAFADVTIRVKFGQITIKRFKILEGESKPWVAFPQVQFMHGLSIRYADILHCNKRVEEYIENQILLAYHRKVAQQKSTCDG